MGLEMPCLIASIFKCSSRLMAKGGETKELGEVEGTYDCAHLDDGVSVGLKPDLFARAVMLEAAESWPRCPSGHIAKG